MVYKRELEKQIAELKRLYSNQAESLRVTMLEEEKKGKRIEELENKIADIKANCDYILEGKEIEYREERNKLCADFENMKATLESKIAVLEQQIDKMKKYIKACWVEENLNDYSSYITNSSDEFRDFVKGLNEEIRNGR